MIYVFNQSNVLIAQKLNSIRKVLIRTKGFIFQNVFTLKLFSLLAMIETYQGSNSGYLPWSKSTFRTYFQQDVSISGWLKLEYFALKQSDNRITGISIIEFQYSGHFPLEYWFIIKCHQLVYYMGFQEALFQVFRLGNE